MLNNKKGFSLSVLIIAIAVIIIITTTAVVSIKNVGKNKEISKFMNDLEEVRQYVVEYYAENNSLPVILENGEAKSAEAELLQVLTDASALSQLGEEDLGDYYYVDITQLGKIHLDDEARGYIVNDGTLNIYVTKPCEYEDVNYYTLTPYLLGENILQNEVTPFQINIMGNPVTWVEEAEILVSLPEVKIGESDGWNFKWLKGSYTATDFKEYEGNGSKVNYFNYGEVIEFTENGIYTIYVESPEKLAIVRKVVVSKIDDIPPTINYEDGKIIIDDAETGVSKIRCKIEENSNFQIDEETKNEYPEYYTMDEEAFGDEKEDLLNKYLWGDENIKGDTVEEYLKKYEWFYTEFSRYNSVLLDLESSNDEKINAMAAIESLNEEYPQFAYQGRRYSDAERNIVLYVEDMVGNQAIYSAVNREELINMQYVSSDALTLMDSKVSINNNNIYTNTRDVSLYLQSMYAKELFITETRGDSPTWVDFDETRLDYTLTLGDGEKTVYAFFKDSQGKTQGVYDQIFLDTTNPTTTAPTVSGDLSSVNIVVNQTDSIIVDGVEIQSGIANVSYGVKEGDGAFNWYSRVGLIPNLVSGVNYTFVTKAVDKAGNEQISDEVIFTVQS